MPPWIFGMQRLDAAVHHFGKAGDVADVDHRQARVGQRLGRAAGRDELEATVGQRLAKRNQAGFIRNTQNRTPHRNYALRETKEKRKPNVMDRVFGIDTKCNGPVSSPQSISADQKAASCGLFLLPQPHPAVGWGSITKVASSHQ